MAEDNYMVKVLILSFVAMLVGAVFITTIATQVTDVTKLTYTSQDITLQRTTSNAVVTTAEFNLTNGDNTGTFRTDDDSCAIATIDVKLANGTQLTKDTEYKYSPGLGNITFLNGGQLLNANGTGTNSTVAYYGYCGDDYIASSWGRTATNLTPGFFALGILAVGIWLWYSIARKENIA